MIVDFYEGECDLYVLLALEVDVRPPRGPIHCKRYKWPADWQARVPTQPTSHIFSEPLLKKTKKRSSQSHGTHKQLSTVFIHFLFHIA